MSTLSKKDFQEVFKTVNSHSLKGQVFLVSENEMDDFLPLVCENCGGWRSRKAPHTQEQCDNHRIMEIMES